MARRVSLGQLVERLRAEAGHSLSPALGQGVRDTLVNTLRRTQEWLYDEFDWPILKVRETIALEAGSIHYDVPEAMNTERVVHVAVKWGGDWLPVDRGITLEREYTIHDSDDDSVRVDPVVKWDIIDTGEREQIEVWPRPATNGSLRIVGIRKLRPMIEDADTCDLDDRLITLFAAAEFLAKQNGGDAQAKLAMANARFASLKARTASRRVIGFNGMPRGNRAFDRQRPDHWHMPDFGPGE